jgi:hypothetical protein
MYKNNESLVLKIIDVALDFKSYKKFNILNAILIGITLSPFLFSAAYYAFSYAFLHFIIQTLLAPSEYLRQRLEEFKAGQLPTTVVFFWAYPTKFFIDVFIAFLMFFEAIYYFFFLVSIWVFSLGGIPFQPYYFQALTEKLKGHKVRENRYKNIVQYIITGIYAVIIFGPIVYNLTVSTIQMTRFRNIVVSEITENLEQSELSNGAVLGVSYIIEEQRLYYSFTEITVGDEKYYIFVDYNPESNSITSDFSNSTRYNSFVTRHENSRIFDGVRTRTIG